MKTVKRWMGLMVCLFLTAVAMVPSSSAADESAMVVGRVYHIEGDLLRYVPGEEDWVAVVRDAPFGTEDTLFSGSRGMAELIVPNGTWIRIGNGTQIQFIALDADLAEMDVASGVARFYNKSSDTVVKVASPFGYVLAYPGMAFDFYVGENSVEVVTIKGEVSFVHAATDARYDVAAGFPSILADQQQVSSGEGTVDLDWNQWNTDRESFWAMKARVRGRSAEYLPPSLQDEAYALEENGRWERVPYEGGERWFWRPIVVVGWSPFTVGRWTDWYGDQTWIPAEPFGYVTHHYGNWVYVGNYWYWAPPVVSVRVGLPLLDVGFYWYPGRVSWIHSGIYVGWVPLAPRETYYSYRHWGGPHAVVVNNVNIAQININVRNYAYANHAVVVNQNNFYRVNNYRNARLTNIDRATIINNSRAAPVVNDTVINNFTTNKQRYNYANVAVKEKPHNTVINRIRYNETIIQGGRKEKASMLKERVKSIREGRVSRETRIEQPKITDNIVPASEVNRPKSKIKLQQREIKARGMPDEQEKPIVRPERVAPAKQDRQEKPFARPRRMTPPKPYEQEKPIVRPERVAPAKQDRQEKPFARPRRMTPLKPYEQEKPIVRPERVVPAKQDRQEKPFARPRRMTPPKPDEQEKPIVRPERVAPPKQAQEEEPDQPLKRKTEKFRGIRPAERGVEATKEGKPQEKVVPGKPKETIKPSERGAVEKPKRPRPFEKEIEKRRERKPPEEEEENPKE